MEINYNDLVFEREISLNSSRSGAHVYIGRYKSQDVAIKVYDGKSPKALKYKFYGINNIGLIEHQNLLKARQNCLEISDKLQEPIGISKTHNQRYCLITKLITNCNGGVSSSLKDFHERISKNFVEELKSILYLMASKKIYHMDINNGDNILVNFNSEIKPIIIDFQSINDIYYPWLKMTKYFGESVEKRYFRRVNRLIKSLEESLD